MKKILLIFLLLFFLGGCSAAHMVAVDKKPDFTSGNDATLVIVRDIFAGKAITVWNYLDGKLIGETKGYTYFIANVSPGLHYVVSESENNTVVQMDFKAGKVYFLRQDIWMGWWRANAGYSVLNKEEALEAIKDCEYWEYDKSNPGEDMNQSEYDQAIKDYHIDVKDKPEEYKPFLEYPGYSL